MSDILALAAGALSVPVAVGLGTVCLNGVLGAMNRNSEALRPVEIVGSHPGWQSADSTEALRG